MNKLLPPPGTTVPPGMYLGIIPFLYARPPEWIERGGFEFDTTG